MSQLTSALQPASIQLRDIKTADIDALAALACDTFNETFGHLYDAADLNAHLENKCSEAFFRDALAQPATRIALAWDGDQCVGYVKWGALELPVADAPEGSLEIHRLYVRASHQRLKLGRGLMEYALAACAGAPAIYLGVWEHNQKAQNFYASYGFTHVGEHAYPVGRQIDRDFIWVRHA